MAYSTLAMPLDYNAYGFWPTTLVRNFDLDYVLFLFCIYLRLFAQSYYELACLLVAWLLRVVVLGAYKCTPSITANRVVGGRAPTLPDFLLNQFFNVFPGSGVTQAGALYDPFRQIGLNGRQA